eukprot:scaffold8315_cov50-Attheya_sp.AAC.5
MPWGGWHRQDDTLRDTGGHYYGHLMFGHRSDPVGIPRWKRIGRESHPLTGHAEEYLSCGPS